jgi:hypothetical protein
VEIVKQRDRPMLTITLPFADTADSQARVTSVYDARHETCMSAAAASATQATSGRNVVYVSEVMVYE